jgi:hypothetical protein
MRVVLFAALVLILGGCASGRTAEFGVAAGSYAAAFDAAREVLRDMRFELDRVDADAGVITTRPKATAGLATLWDAEQSLVGQEVEDLLNHQRRRVRVSFRVLGGAGESQESSSIPSDIPLVLRVEATLHRMQTPGLRPSSKAISMTTTSIDPVQTARGQGSQYEVKVAEDEALAARLAEKIRRRVRGSSPRQARALEASYDDDPLQGAGLNGHPAG